MPTSDLPILLSSIAAVILSLLAAYLPGFSPWYAALPGPHKRLLMLAALIATTGVIFALVCSPFAPYLPPPLSPEMKCDASTAVTLITAFIAALAANQATFTLAVRTKPSSK